MSLTALGGVLSLAVLLTAFWFLSQNQRSTAVAARRAHDDAQAMLVGLLEQERGLDDFATRRDPWSLELYERGRREFERKQAAMRLWVGDDSVGSTLLATSSAAARTWQRAAERSLRQLRATGTVSEDSASTDAVAADLLLDTFRSDTGRSCGISIRRRSARTAAGGTSPLQSCRCWPQCWVPGSSSR